MAKYRVGIIGTGKPWRSEGATGFGMSHRHVQGYKQSEDCELVALCDLVEENARAFMEQHGGQEVYTDYHEMLAKANLDIVSVCTWPHLHAPMVVACAEAGVKAVHCEKPMATTFGDARRMVEACDKSGTQLTFNHQRRFNKPFRKAKELLDSGVVGDLIQMDATCGNLYDWGTHWFDMLGMFNNETPGAWVIGQIDLRGAKPIFGAMVEGQGVSHFKYQNGVYGTLITGYECPPIANIRLRGTEGIIELGVPNGPNLRYLNTKESGWQEVETGDTLHGDQANADGVLDLVDALKNGREPELAGRRALNATELIFGTYESSRRRARVDLPLDTEDSALLDLLEQEKQTMAAE
ncbi:MAG: Gfo/Idh/MocA family oxidoreductase [Armatimonadaceae bacterium]